MWELNELGIASWTANDAICSMDLRGGVASFGLYPFVGRDESSALAKEVAPISLAAVGDQVLPLASEQYVCQDRLTVNYPQDQAAYAIRLSVEPMKVAKTQLVLELTVSIQTDLLDSHPMLDLVIPGPDATSHVLDAEAENWRQTLQGASLGSDSMHCVESDQMSVGVLLDCHDAPTTKTMSDSDGIRLRLFGDFLEKGVIRTARPWIIIDRSGDALSSDTVMPLYRQLEERPLPLAT